MVRPHSSAIFDLCPLTPDCLPGLARDVFENVLVWVEHVCLSSNFDLDGLTWLQANASSDCIINRLRSIKCSLHLSGRLSVKSPSSSLPALNSSPYLYPSFVV